MGYERIKTSSDWPKLKAKSAATRHLAEYAWKLAQEYHDGSEHDRRREAVAALLVRWYDMVYSEGRYMASEKLEEFSNITKWLVKIYLQLAREAANSCKRLWKMTGKFHYFEHIGGEQARVCNPRYSWTYSDEDLMRIMKEVALSCHPSTVAHMVLFKWVIWFFEN